MKWLKKLQIWWFKYNNPPLDLVIPVEEDLRVINLMFEMVGCWKDKK